MTRPARPAGFTLLEILLALVLLGFVMLGVWGAMRSATRVTRSAGAVMARSESVRTVQQFLRRYVGAAQPQAYTDGPDTPPRMFRGDATSMQYVAPLPLQSGHAGLYVQTVELKAGAAGTRSLWLTYRPYGGSADPAAAPARHLLLDGLHAGKLQYLAAGAFGQPAAWHPDWQAAHGLPAAVRIELDPAWRVGVPFPALVIRIQAGGGAASIGGGVP
ncbi:MAG: prepilin-type N-terminal cleavage/methylation domain-containing protein [Rhodanobacteraceae bacterium]|nr:MAG: prepilin-type N-terminal cleavage/methylation domain-containing protein [Rhodanobacteraceae bacterium]